MMTPVQQATVRDAISQAFAPMVALQEILGACPGKVTGEAVADVMQALLQHAERSIEQGLNRLIRNDSDDV